MQNEIIKKCKYSKCKHGGIIDITEDDFLWERGNYYHKDCFKERSDLSLIRNLWVSYISDTVVYSRLNKVLNELLEIKSVSSDYLVFVLKYVIDNHLKLNYPEGFKYYVDDHKIKEAYKKKMAKKVKNADFSAKDDEIQQPTFSIPKRRDGFGSIIGG